jgi:hypothetical protein
MWPDMSEYAAEERFPAPGFTYPDGRPASLFSSDHEKTVLRHFQWMHDYGIDGVWLQQFVVDLPSGPFQERYPSRRRVLEHVRKAAKASGRVWALAYDIAGMPAERIFDVLTADWKKLVDDKIAQDERYLHEGGLPVVQVWGFYRNQPATPMTANLAHRLIDFFKSKGPYAAYVVGGCDWAWRRNPDSAWQEALRRLDAYAPWNVGNYRKDSSGAFHAATETWDEDLKECQRRGMLWLPVIYPGFSWDNLQHQKPGTTMIPRQGGRFLWEQFHELSRRHVASAIVAMFDEVDEGTAIFKITNSPPTQGHFLGTEGLPSDWYLRLVGEGTRRLHDQRPIPEQIPIRP